MNPHNRTTLAVGFVLLFLTVGVAVSQDSSSKADENKTKLIEVRVQVSTQDGKTLPANSMVEISGQEKACGSSLNSNDARTAINQQGEAIFREVPVCKVTVKLNLNLYVPFRKVLDLADYKAPIKVILEPEQ